MKRFTGAAAPPWLRRSSTPGILEGVDTIKVVLVTNAGQGFGRTIALAFGALGFDVVCADRDVDLASKTAAEVEEAGGQAIPIQADMSVHMDVLNAFGKVFEIFGDLGGLVHIADHESTTLFERLGEGEFSELVGEDLRSCFLTLRTATRMLENAWVLLIGPPTRSHEPHMWALRSAIEGLVRGTTRRFDGLLVNALFPSRSAADPKHDAQIAALATFLGTAPATGLAGQVFDVALPPPPKLVESLLPEVQAALDDNVRQDDLEASLFDEAVGRNSGDGRNRLDGNDGDDYDADDERLAYDDLPDHEDVSSDVKPDRSDRPVRLLRPPD